MSKYKVQESTEISTRNSRIVHWGAAGTRKTETALRLYPKVFMIDIEGNGDQCVGQKEVPVFLRFPTTNVYEVIDLVEAASKGEFKFKDGSLPETLLIDGMAMLWAVRQEVAADRAESRMNRFKSVSADDINITQNEWGVAKRPMKALSTALANAPFRYIVLTAREKPLTAPKPGKPDEVVNVGFTWDAMKGLDYEANLAFRFFSEDAVAGNKLTKGPWKCEVTKVQGALGAQLPIGKILDAYPIDIIKAHARAFKPTIGTAKSDMAVAKDQAARENEKPVKVETKAATAKVETAKATPFSTSDLVAYATALNVTVALIGPALRANPETNPDKWDPAKATLYKAVVDQLAQQAAEAPKQ